MWTIRAILTAVVACAVPLAIACILLGTTGQARSEDAVQTGVLPKEIDESSGLLHSRKYPDKDIFWTHNDSGDKARIFAVNSKGELLREVHIKHADNKDWEEITADESGRIIICDIGNNSHNRHTLTLYRIPEPDALNPNEKPPHAEVFNYKYPEGAEAHDTEALVTRGGYAWLFTKQLKGILVYRMELPNAKQEKTEDSPPARPMELVAETRTFNIVAGSALSNDGKRLVLINYITLMILDLPEPLDKMQMVNGRLPIFEAPRSLMPIPVAQTEGVAWDTDEKSLYFTNEQRGIHKIKAPPVKEVPKDAAPK